MGTETVLAFAFFHQLPFTFSFTYLHQTWSTVEGWSYQWHFYFKGVFTPRTTLCSKLHLIIFKWMTALPVNEFAPYRSHNLLKITLWHLSASSKRHFLFTFKFYFLFCGKKWWFLVLWGILIQKHNWSETCTPSCEELRLFKEFALIKNVS